MDRRYSDRRFLIYAVAIAMVLALASPSPLPADDEKGTAVIRGRVTTEKPGKPRAIRIPRIIGAFCRGANARPRPDPATFVYKKQGNAVPYALVYISKGITGRYAPPDKPALVAFEKCEFVPHVVAMVAGQPLDIVNRDRTAHNINASPKRNTPINIAQPNPSVVSRSGRNTFGTPEMGIRLRCAVHGWEGAWCHVLAHPFFDVTKDHVQAPKGKEAERGTFEIRELPAGAYTVTAWHAGLGSVSREVRVAKGETIDVNLLLERDAAAIARGLEAARVAKNPIPAVIVESAFLVAQLKDSEQSARRAAIETLRTYPDESATAVLGARELLKSDDPAVRLAVIQAWAHVGWLALPNVPALTQALDDDVASVREAAADALAAIGPDALPAMAEALRNQTPTLHRRAAAAIARMDRKPSREALAALRPMLTAAVRESLSDTDAVVRERAIQTLAALDARDDATLTALDAAMRDDNRWVRLAAADALAGAGEQGIRLLSKAIRDENESVRLNAIEAVGRAGPDAALATDALIAALGDSMWINRLYAARALSAIGPAAVAAKPVLTRMAEDDPNTAVRRAAKDAVDRVKRR